MEKINDTKSLGMLIHQERKQQGLTQEQLAGVIGVGVRFLRELEVGKENCQIGRAMQVLAGLGLAVSVGRRQSLRSWPAYWTSIFATPRPACAKGLSWRLCATGLSLLPSLRHVE